MYRYRQHRPTKHYDEKVRPLDQQLCELIAKRKSVSSNNPGFPPIEQINTWAENFGLYENHLHSVFHTLYNEQLHRPRIEPSGFLGIKPVMKLDEEESQAYLITHLWQYENASVLNFQIDSSVENEEEMHPTPIEWELSLGPDYDCYSSGGGGNHQHWAQRFVISPRLPDDVKDITFKFSWRYLNPNEDNEDDSGEILLR